MEQTEAQAPKKKYQYVCAVRRKPYLSPPIREARHEKRLEKMLSAAVFIPLGDDIGELNLRPISDRIHAAFMAQQQEIDGRGPHGGPYVWPPNSKQKKRQERMNRKRRRGWA